MSVLAPQEVRLLDRAVAGVLGNAQVGELPPAAWTLGLPWSEWRMLLDESLVSVPVSLSEGRFLLMRSSIPQVFRDLVDMLLDHASPASDALSTRWAAHVIAAACLGNRHLWEDLGLSGRAEVTALLDHYFQPLARRRDTNLRWKRFLFLELGARRGEADMRPPGCARCGDFRLCFGDSENG